MDIQALGKFVVGCKQQNGGHCKPLEVSGYHTGDYDVTINVIDPPINEVAGSMRETGMIFQLQISLACNLAIFSNVRIPCVF